MPGIKVGCFCEFVIIVYPVFQIIDVLFLDFREFSGKPCPEKRRGQDLPEESERIVQYLVILMFP